MKRLVFHVNEIRRFGWGVTHRYVIALLVRIYQPVATAIFLLVARLLRPLVLVRVGYIDTLRIGHHLAWPWFILVTENTFASASNRIRYDIYFPGLRNPNPVVLRKWRERLRVWPGWVIGGGVPNRLLTSENRLNKGHVVRWPIGMKENMDRVRSKPPQLVLTQEELSYSRDKMEAIGLPSGAPWVSLNVRDSAWLSHVFPSSTWQLNSHRDSQIESYVLAVQALIDLGWYVVRTGAKVEKKIPLKHPRLIDYPFSGIRSEILDLYLSSQCSYMISTGTGIDTFAWLNQVPTLYVNYFPHALIDSYGVPSMVIFKNHLNAQQRYLKLSEILDLQILDPSDSNTLQRLGITFEDNSAEDIANAVLEMNNWVEMKKCNFQFTPLQAQLYQTLKSKYNSKVNESMLPLIPTTFLSKNLHWTC